MLMKTKIYALPDWKMLLREVGWENAPTKADIEAEILRELTRGKVTFEEAPCQTPIQKSFRVTLQTRSALPKFNKEKTVITVGSGLYDRGMEAMLCGMLAGQSGEAEVKSEQVAFTVLKVEQKQFPPLTDALVQELQIDGIQDLYTYHRFIAEKVKTEYASALVQKIVDRLIANAEMDDVAQEDISQVLDLEYAPLQARFSLDAMSSEEWEKAFGDTALRDFYAQIYPDVARLFGTTGKESYYASRKEAAKETIRTCLVIGKALGSDTDPTKEPNAEQLLREAMIERVLCVIYGGE